MTSIEETAESGAPRYLVARVGTQRVAWVMSTVREIVPVQALTRLPGSPDWVLGLTNLRGSVLTVVDLSRRLGLGVGSAGSVIVVDLDGRALGVRVDAVETVAQAADDRVEGVEEARRAEGLVRGMVRLEGGTALLMDADALLRSVLVAA